MPFLTRRHLLASAAATAAVAAMPAHIAIAAVEAAPARMAGWAFVSNEKTKPLLGRLPIDTMAADYVGVLFGLIGESKRATIVSGPHKWMPVTIVDGRLSIVGAETGSYRTACIDAGWQLEAL